MRFIASYILSRSFFFFLQIDHVDSRNKSAHLNSLLRKLVFGDERGHIFLPCFSFHPFVCLVHWEVLIADDTDRLHIVVIGTLITLNEIFTLNFTHCEISIDFK